MTELPAPSWPLQFVTNADGTVTYGDLEQDTDAERKASAATIAATPRGAHLGDETFGVTTPLFETVPLDTERLAREIAQSDPRLDLTVTETADLLTAARRTLTVRVGSVEPPGVS
jgi:hypothetical protein